MMTVALVVRTVAPSVEVASVVSTTMDVCSMLATLAPFLLSGGEQMPISTTTSSTTTYVLVISAEADPSTHVEIPQSPDLDTLIELEIQILIESLMKLFNRSVESALATWKGLSARTLALLRNQLGLLTSIAGTVRTEPFKKMINEVELQFQELQRLRVADVDGIVELEFRQLSVKHREVEEAARKEMVQINRRLQELNNSLALVDGNWAELNNAILEREATINEAKAAIVTAQARLEAAQQQKEALELKSTELAREWDLKAVKLQAETTRLGGC